MPRFIDDAGYIRNVHQGYEGTKYRELGTMKRSKYNWKTKVWALGAVLLLSYGYIKMVSLIEVNNAEATRGLRAAELARFKEKNPALFAELVATGRISATGSYGERPMDRELFLRTLYPEEYDDMDNGEAEKKAEARSS